MWQPNIRTKEKLEELQLHSQHLEQQEQDRRVKTAADKDASGLQLLSEWELTKDYAVQIH